MAKLYFNYGAMNSGKTITLMAAAYNYEERDQKVIVIKPAVDTKGDKKLISRIGLSREVNILLSPNDSAYDLILPYYKSGLACVFIDEAQFLLPKQVDDLFIVAKALDVPVICYGLRADFQTKGFPGSIRLMELADEMAELATICRCGKKARFNGRKVNGEFVSEGAQIAIDETDEVTYESLCGVCYLDKVMHYDFYKDKMPDKTLVKK